MTPARRAGGSMPFVSTTMRMMGGFLTWAAHFAAIYGLTALACARGFAEAAWLGVGVVPWGIGIATVVALAAIVLLTAGAARTAAKSARGPGFLTWMTIAAGAAGVVAIIWQAIPVLIVPVCV
jgi:hypothetical protein